ncbi:sigma-70 family RNA polymerase sigma factor [Streptomyces luteoverticillatus]|uniref:sigma-70 family RNA polymerase sigma factor n=1 Tax=Streptomyces luteoverticillatus TaxID=66425 RepID=UPI0013DF68A3|nr:sigma-70 family RNA polymerase sigma factor [Streptomyces luteoverticillatus]
MTVKSVTGVTGVVEAARAGDAGAQGELVAACLPLVYNIVGRALKGHADVDDVVQETMIRMVGGLSGLRDASRFRSWLVAIAVNRIRGHWRRQQDAPVGGLQEACHLSDPGADFVELTILRLGLEGQRRQVAEATRWLDDDERAALSLWWLEATGELTRAEVAAALELTPQHTAVRIQRTKLQLETARAVVRALATTPRCPELAGIVGIWDGTPSPLWRKRIARHTRGCAECGGHWTALIPAEGLLAGLGLVPVSGALMDRFAAGALGVQPVGCATGGASSGGAGGVAPGTSSGTAAGTGRGRTRRPGVRAVVTAVALAVTVAIGVLGGYRYLAPAPDGSGTRDGNQGRGAENVVLPLTSLRTELPSPPVPAPSASSPAARTATSASAPAHRPVVPESARTPSAPTSAHSTAPVRTPAPAVTPGADQRDETAREVERQVNKERAKAGCGPLRASAELVVVARRGAGELALGARLDATREQERERAQDREQGPEKAEPGHRWSLAGMASAGRADVAGALTVWTRGATRHDVVRDCSLTELGVAVTFTAGSPHGTPVVAAR